MAPLEGPGMQADSLYWRALEFYGNRVRHKGKWRVHEFLRRFAKIEACDLIVRREGVFWRLDPSDFVQSSLYWIGEFEGFYFANFSRWVNPDSIVLDIGANFGYYSVRLGSMLSTGHVYCFEPSPRSFERLKTNLELNRLENIATPVQLGLSDSSGAARIATDGNNSGHHHISDTGQPITVDTLDSFCERCDIKRVDLIKIDIEGHEMHALRGGEKTIQRHHPRMMVEIFPRSLQEQGASATELVSWLTERGYQLWVLRRDKLVPFGKMPGPDDVINVFAIPSA